MNKVTIITVCYNAVKVIENTIKSVVNQTYPEKEYIIIDGGSIDGTIDIIKKYEGQIDYWLSEPDKGIYDAMNKGILKATGDFINFMNAGDSFYSNTVLQLFFSLFDSKADIAYGDTMMIYNVASVLRKPDPLEGITSHMVFGHQATFIRAAYHKSHLFDLSYCSSGDYNFFYNSYVNGAKFQYIPVIVANYEAEDGMSAKNHLLSQRENARIQGINKSLKWKLNYCVYATSFEIKNFIKRLLPTKIVDIIRAKNLRK